MANHGTSFRVWLYCYPTIIHTLALDMSLYRTSMSVHSPSHSLLASLARARLSRSLSAAWRSSSCGEWDMYAIILYYIILYYII